MPRHSKRRSCTSGCMTVSCCQSDFDPYQIHSFRQESLSSPHPCQHCKESIWNEGSICTICGTIAHRKCESFVTLTCAPGHAAAVQKEEAEARERQKHLEARRQQAVGSIQVDESEYLRARPRVEMIFEANAGGGTAGLEVTYITKHLLAVWCDDSLKESVYAASIRDVGRLLRDKHGGNCRVINLSERRQDIHNCIPAQVHDQGWPATLAPPLERLCSICKSVDTYLSEHDENVIVLHCKGGLGRLAVLLSAFRHYLSICANDEQAIDQLAMKVFLDDKLKFSVHPSQERYVQYFAGLLTGDIRINSSPLYLQHIVLRNPPELEGQGTGSRIFVRVYQGMTIVWTSGVYIFPTDSPLVVITPEAPIILRGDILIKAYHKRQQSRDVVFRTQFHVAALSESQLKFNRVELDDANRDSRVNDSFSVEFLFSANPSETTTAPASGGQYEIEHTQDQLVRYDSYANFAANQDLGLEPGQTIATRPFAPSATPSDASQRNFTQESYSVNERGYEVTTRTQTMTSTQDTRSGTAESHKTLAELDDVMSELMTTPSRSANTTPGFYHDNQQQATISQHQMITSRQQEPRGKDKLPFAVEGGLEETRRARASMGTSPATNGGITWLEQQQMKLLAKKEGMDWLKRHENEKQVLGELRLAQEKMKKFSQTTGVQSQRQETLTPSTIFQREHVDHQPTILHQNANFSSQHIGAFSAQGFRGASGQMGYNKSHSVSAMERQEDAQPVQSNLATDYFRQVNSQMDNMMTQQKTTSGLQTSSSTTKYNSENNLAAANGGPPNAVTYTVTVQPQSGERKQYTVNTSQQGPFDLTDSSLLLDYMLAGSGSPTGRHSGHIGHQPDSYMQGRATDTASYMHGAQADSYMLNSAAADQLSAYEFDSSETLHQNGSSKPPTTPQAVYQRMTTPVNLQRSQSSSVATEYARQSVNQQQTTQNSTSSTTQQQDSKHPWRAGGRTPIPVLVNGSPRCLSPVIHSAQMGTQHLPSPRTLYIPARRRVEQTTKHTVVSAAKKKTMSESGMQTDQVEMTQTEPEPEYIDVMMLKPIGRGLHSLEPEGFRPVTPSVGGRPFTPFDASRQSTMIRSQSSQGIPMMRSPSVGTPNEHNQFFRYPNQSATLGRHGATGGSGVLQQQNQNQYNTMPSGAFSTLSSDQQGGGGTISNGPPGSLASRPTKVREHTTEESQTIHKEYKGPVRKGQQMGPDSLEWRHEQENFPATPASTLPKALGQHNANSTLTREHTYSSVASKENHNQPISVSVDQQNGGQPGDITPRFPANSPTISLKSELTENQTAPRHVQEAAKWWYKPKITREEAISILRDQQAGTFIIRDSNTFKGAFGLAVKVAQLPPNIQPKPGADPQSELVRHFLIEPTSNGVRLKGCSNEPVFSSLAALVHQHSLTPLALPCKLLLPDRERSLGSSVTQSAVLEQGAACNVIFVGQVDVESLTGPRAVSVSYKHLLNSDQKPTVVHFKVSSQGLTLTDTHRQLFLRRHFAVPQLLWAGLDPDRSRFQRRVDTVDGALNQSVFGVIFRQQLNSTQNTCLVFAELDEDQPAQSIVNFLNNVLLQ